MDAPHSERQASIPADTAAPEMEAFEVVELVMCGVIGGTAIALWMAYVITRFHLGLSDAFLLFVLTGIEAGFWASGAVAGTPRARQAIRFVACLLSGKKVTESHSLALALHKQLVQSSRDGWLRYAWPFFIGLGMYAGIKVLPHLR